MAANRGTVAVKYTGDNSDLKRANTESQKTIADLGDNAKASFSKVSVGAAAVGVGMLAMGKNFVSAAEDSQKTTKQTEAVLKSMGGQANVTADDVGNLADALSKKSGVDDEVIQSGENVLLTFGKVRNEVGAGNDIFNRATTAALDMSVALGTDLQSATTMLGKALNDPIKGITAMTRAGVSFTEQQKDQIKTMVQSGDTLGAQKLIMKELESEFSGSAAAQATASEKLGVAFGNLEEKIGGLLLPAFDTLAGAGGEVIELFDKIPAPMQAVVVQGAAVVGGLLAIGGTVSFAVDHLRNMKANLGDIIPGLKNMSSETPKVAAGVKAITVAASAFIALDLAGHVLDAIDPLQNFDANKVTQGLLDLNDNLAASGELAKVVGGDFGKLKDDVARIADPSVLQRFNDFSSKMTDLVTFGHDGSSAIEEARNRVDALDTALADLAGKSAPQAHAALDQIKAAIGPDAYDQLYDRLTKTQSAFAGLDVNARLAADGQDVVAASTDGATGSLDEEAASLQKLQDALLASFDSNLAYRQAVDGATDAVSELNKMTAAGKTGTEEYSDKLLDTEGAALRQAAAAVKQADDQAKANGQTLDARDKNRIYAGELENVASKLAPGSPLRAQLQAYIDQLRDLDGKNVNTTITTTHITKDEFYGKGSAAYEREHRAGGGPVRKGQPYVVGEKRPELFVPDQNGTILPSIPAGVPPAAPAHYAPSAPALYNTLTINVDARGAIGTNRSEVERWIVGALNSAQRKGIR